MTKKARYIIIACSILFFLIVAPIIVLYVKGISYDFTEKKFISTGILAIKSKPENSSVYLNGKLAKEKAGNIKFLKPGEYNVTLYSPGYWPWKKTLRILPAQVTWAHPADNKIFLFYEKPILLGEQKNILDFAVVEKKLVLLNSQGQLAISKPNTLEIQETISFTQPILEIKNIYNNEFLLLLTQTDVDQNGLWYFNLTSNSSLALPELKKTDYIIQATKDKIVYIREQSLFEMDFETHKQKMLLKNVSTAQFNGQDLFYLQKNEDKTSLIFSPNLGKENQTLLENINSYSQAKIYIDAEKQLFLLLDNQLYKYNGQLNLLANNLVYADLNQEKNCLLIISGGELGWYENSNDYVRLITRTSSNLSYPNLIKNLNMAFYAKNGQVIATELDLRDKQNEYLLTKAENLKKILFDENAEILWLLDGTNLTSLKIR